MKTLDIFSLPREAQTFVNDVIDANAAKAKDGDPTIPLFYREGNEALLIYNYSLPWSAYKDFEKQKASSLGLYRGGIVMNTVTDHGMICVPDERSKWFKPFPAAIAVGEEGWDLIETGRRENVEEVFIISLGKKDRVRYVPNGVDITKADSFSPAFNIKVDRIERFGEVVKVDEYFNDDNSAFEYVLQWDIRGLENFTVACQEDWFEGGNPIIIPVTIKDGTITGFYSGQQGWQPLLEYGLHPAIKRQLSKVAA